MTPTVPAELQSGRYTVTDLLGLGGMAVVHRAYDHNLGVWRAAKFLLPQFISRDRVVARFNSEAHAMARLDHTNIVRVHDVGVQDGVPYMVMELAHGGSLEQWLDLHGAMPPRLAVDAILQVCQGITAAHDEGIVHRDMKPDNVLVDRKGVCKLTDFGIAQIEDISSYTRTGTAMGTIAYMAPEQKKDAKNVSPLADVYGLAATLWALLTGDIPMDLFMAEHQPMLLNDVIEPLQPALLGALAFDPARRTASANAFAAALRQVYDQLPETPADTPSLVTQLQNGNPTPPVVQPAARNRASPSGSSNPPDMGGSARTFKPLPYYQRQPATPAQTPLPLESLYQDDRRDRARERLEALEKRSTPAPVRRARSKPPVAASPGPQPLRTIEPAKQRLDTSTDGTVPRLRSPNAAPPRGPGPRPPLVWNPKWLWGIVPTATAAVVVLGCLIGGSVTMSRSAANTATTNRALYLTIEHEKGVLLALERRQRVNPERHLVRLRAMEDGPERLEVARAYLTALHAASATGSDPTIETSIARLDTAFATADEARNTWKQKSGTVLGSLACAVHLARCP